MNQARRSGWVSVRAVLLAAGTLAALAASAVAAGPRQSAEGGPGVVRVRRGDGGGGGGEGAGVVRSFRAARVEMNVDPPPSAAADVSQDPAGAPDGGTTDEVVDQDPIGAGLPDSQPGGPTGTGGGPGRGQEIEFFDIGVRGKRSGRTIILWGAEFAFVNCEIAVEGGLPVGYTGVMGEVGPNPGSASAIQFTLQAGGEITLTVQPAASGSLTAPNRPVRTLTMQVP